MNSSYPSPTNSKAKVSADSVKFLSFFESYLSDLIGDFDPSIRNLAQHVVLNGGKRIRPFLVYTCGAGNPEATEYLLKASSVIEIVHVATLVHDDILDSASLRRNKPTLHSQFGEHTAILLGDALFSFALELATDFPDSSVCRIVSRSTRKTCSGEINQNFNKGNFHLSADDYFAIIQDKTGELFSASCMIGAHLAGGNDDLIDILSDFGNSLGLNYQIYDDLIDTFGNSFTSGKTLGTDFQSGKVTLPVIRLLESLPQSISEPFLDTFSENSTNEDFKKYFGRLLIDHCIHEICLLELEQRLERSKLIASNIPDPALAKRLLSFLSSFDHKLEKLDSNLLPNFLALH
jgi:octaprenyl-diphosphate synthase